MPKYGGGWGPGIREEYHSPRAPSPNIKNDWYSRIAWRQSVTHAPWRSQNKETIKAMMKGISPINRGLGSKIVYGWLDKFSRALPQFSGKGAIGVGIAFGGLAMAAGIGGNLKKSIKWRSIDKPSTMIGGPGYISWNKTSGMPSDHLSTNGLSLSLSKMRHSSIL